MEPVPDPTKNLKTVAGVVWIALITAVIVTVIDWKIKQDILRITDAFYRVKDEVPVNENTSVDRRDSVDSLLRFSGVDTDARVETGDVPESNPLLDGDEKERIFWDSIGELERDADAGETSDTGPVQA